MRDSQRQKIYDSEHGADHGERFKTVGECQAYVDRVLARKRLHKKYPRLARMEIEVQDGRGRRSGVAQTVGLGHRIIKLPLFARTELYICHEIAHHLVSRGCAPHGWEFAMAYLAIVREMLGKERHDALRAEFKKRRVRFREPSSRSLSPEQRAAAAERLAAARAARAGTEGVWGLVVTHTNGAGEPVDVFLRNLTMKWGLVYFNASRGQRNAQTWKLRESAEKWREKLAVDGHKDVRVIDLAA